MAQREHVTPSSALELFLDAFDGMPIQAVMSCACLLRSWRS